jgi:sigma-B regulation protein RsbU (phosphoserine phosphatase)
MAKILLVDDSEANRSMLARRLARRGHQVLIAADGEQAVEMATSQLPDVILMDLNLPVLDGWRATRQIKDAPQTSAVPVIALTAHAMSGDRQKALAAGCDDYDTKPVDFPRLLSKIDALARPKGEPDTAHLPKDSLPDISEPPPGEGTAAAKDANRQSDVASIHPALGGHILVVDDTQANREMAARRLTRNGFTVETASDGTAALQLIRTRSYDAILLDVMMPGIDGLAVLRTIRQSHGPTDLPVIMATARDKSEAIVEALELGANDYVTKPLDFPVLLARLRTQLSLKRTVEQNRQLEHGLEQRNAQLEAANQRMANDLAAAGRIQAALLPAESPRVPGYHFAWLFQPSVGVGGDILNAFPLDDEHAGLYVLDVSGHGVAAALLSVSVSRFLSPLPDPSSLLWRRVESASSADARPSPLFQLETPAAVAQRLGLRFPIDNATHQYFTMVYGLLNTRSHQLRYISAGHPNLLHLPATGPGKVIEASGYPIGVAPDSETYDEYTIELAQGDRVYIHSDGVTEAMNERGELFDVSRTLLELEASRTESLEESLRQLSSRLKEWTGKGDTLDDQTVLAIERLRTLMV